MTIVEWTGLEVAALRTTLRDTREQFADRIGCSFEAVRKWERKGRSITLRPKYAECMDTTHGRLDDEQRARFEIAISTRYSGTIPLPTPSQEAQGVYHAMHEDDVDRREFGKLAISAAAAIALTGTGDRIGIDEVRQLQSAVDALHQQDQRSGGASLVDFAVAQLTRARKRLETAAYNSATGNAFASATGELAMLCGWLAYDADRNVLAQRCYGTAMAIGAEVGHDDLIAHTCLYMANQSNHLARTGLGGSPYKTLQLTERARDLMRGRPPGRVHALIAIRDAQARALLGDLAAFGRAVATVWRELDSAMCFEPPEDVPQCLRFVTHSEAADQEARGYADVGDLSRSVELYAAAVEQPAAMRNATMIRAWSAATRARIGDIGGALEHGHAALANVNTVSSARMLSRLAPVRAAVTDSRSGADFRDMYDSLHRKAITV